MPKKELKMKSLRSLTSIICTLFVVACLYASASGQTGEDRNKLAAISGAGSSVRWDVAIPNAGIILTISTPDGRVFRKEFRSGAAAEFTLSDQDGNKLPDGQYTYELRLTPVFTAAAKEELAATRGKDDEAEAVRAARKRPVLPNLVQSGSFSVVNG